MDGKASKWCQQCWQQNVHWVYLQGISETINLKTHTFWLICLNAALTIHNNEDTDCANRLFVVASIHSRHSIDLHILYSSSRFLCLSFLLFFSRLFGWVISTSTILGLTKYGTENRKKKTKPYQEVERNKTKTKRSVNSHFMCSIPTMHSHSSCNHLAHSLALFLFTNDQFQRTYLFAFVSLSNIFHLFVRWLFSLQIWVVTR